MFWTSKQCLVFLALPVKHLARTVNDRAGHPLFTPFSPRNTRPAVSQSVRAVDCLTESSGDGGGVRTHSMLGLLKGGSAEEQRSSRRVTPVAERGRARGRIPLYFCKGFVHKPFAEGHFVFLHMHESLTKMYRVKSSNDIHNSNLQHILNECSLLTVTDWTTFCRSRVAISV